MRIGLAVLLLLAACSEGPPPPVDRGRVDQLFKALEVDDWPDKKAAARELGEIARYDDEVLRRLAALPAKGWSVAAWVEIGVLRFDDARPRMLSGLLTTLLDPNVSYDHVDNTILLLQGHKRELLEFLEDREDLSDAEREALTGFVRKLRHVDETDIDPVVGEHWRVEDPPLEVTILAEPISRAGESGEKSRWASAPGIPLSNSAVPVTVRDAATGAPIQKFRAAVYDPVTWEIRKTARADDVLFVYARGYDLFEKTLAGDESRIDVSLTAATRAGRIEMPAAAWADVFVTARVHRRSPVGKGWIVCDVVPVDLDDPGAAELSIPEGMDGAHIVIEPKPGWMAWPMSSLLAPGGSLWIHAEPLPNLLLRTTGRTDRLALSIDRCVSPPWGPDRIDALRNLVRSLRWSPDAWRTPEGVNVAGVPGTGWHVFATVDGRVCYANLPPGELEIDLPMDSPKPVIGRPVVDGEPVPDGTILAPGALDLATLRRIAHRDHRADGYSHAVHRRTDWSKLRLPAASEITVFHPAFGVAWLDWTGVEPPSGPSLSGRLTLRAADGGTLTGSVLLQPAWRARGATSTFSADPSPYQSTAERAVEMDFGGLPPGRYELTGEINGERVRKSVEIVSAPVVLDPR